MLSLLATATLEKALNQCLQLDPEGLTQVTALEGKVIAIRLQGPGLEFFLIPTEAGVRVQSVFEGEPDVRIKGGPLSLARMGLGYSKGLLGEGVEFEGDTSLGKRVQSILDGLELDWEEQLSRATGDVVAHQVGNLVRGAVAWGRNAGEILARDVAEYFQEESRDLPVAEEVSEFLDRVDTLRMDVERLEQRVARLQGKAGGA